jgi:hypothetical protein
LRKVSHHGLTGEVIRKEYDFLGFADAIDADILK